MTIGAPPVEESALGEGEVVADHPDRAAPARVSWHRLALDARAVATLALCFFGVVVIRRAWVSDDAFISLRVAANLVHGHGLTFNPGERVQGFSDPLWVLVLAGVIAVVKSGYAAAVLTSIVSALLGAIVLSRWVARDGLTAALALAVLGLSNAYGDFSTSGLENPLSHLLLFGFLAASFRALEAPSRRLRLASWVLAALLVLTRPDSLILIAPSLALVAWRRPWRESARLAVLGFSPVAAWVAFAFVYYGFLQPNTAISKLQSSIPRVELAAQGAVYLLDAAERDPLTLVVIVFALVVGASRGGRAARAVALGIGLHLVYVVSIGGDFMAGRFLTLPFAAAVALLASRLFELDLRTGLAVAAGAVGILAALSPYNPFRDGAKPKGLPPSGIVSERDWFVEQTGLAANLRRHEFKSHAWWVEGVKARDGTDTVVVHANAGLFGFAAGPDRHVVDLAGLTDPLLARIPFKYIPDWRTGHLGRKVPAGYLDTLRTGNDTIADPHLRACYEALRPVVRGPIWSLSRFRLIVELNLGLCDRELRAAKLE